MDYHEKDNKMIRLPQFDYTDWDQDHDFFSLIHGISSDLAASSIPQGFDPQVSVMIPAYRRPDMIGDTVRSVLSQKGDVRYVVIVVDDSAEDLSVQEVILPLIRQYPNIALYRNEQNLGQAGNWNRCIELSMSRWMVLLHDDDMMCPDYLETIWETSQKFPCTEIGVFQYRMDERFLMDKGLNTSAGGQVREANNAVSYSGKVSSAQKVLCDMRRKKPFVVHKEDLFQFVAPSPGCWFFDRDFALQIGGFNPSFGPTLDGIFHFTNTVRGKTIIIPDFLMIRRIEKNLSLKSNVQLQVVSMLYGFGKNLLRDYPLAERERYQRLLDLSEMNLLFGVRGKYLPDFPVQEAAESLGIAEHYRRMSGKKIFLLNGMHLLKLIFRSTRC